MDYPRTSKVRKKTPKILVALIAASILFAIFAGVALLAGIGYYSETFERSSELDEAKERARKAGMILEEENLYLEPAPREEDNGAADFLRAHQAVEAQGGWEKYWSKATEAFSKPLTQEAALLLSDLREPLSHLDAALQKPDLRFDRSWKDGIDVDFSEYENVRPLAHLIGIRSRRKAAAGNWSAALEDLASIAKLARLLDQQPGALSYYIATTTWGIYFRTSQRLADVATEPIVQKLHELHKQVKARNFRHSYLTDAFLSYQSYQRGISNPGLSREVAKYYRAQAAVIEHTLGTLEIPDSQASPPLISKRLLEAERQNRRRYGDKFVEEIVPMPSEMYKAEQSWTVMKDATEALLRIRTFQLKHGRNPRSLKEVGFSARDPFDGKQLRYTTYLKTVRVYSVGEDLKDDNGTRRSDAERRKEKTWDRVELLKSVGESPRSSAAGLRKGSG